MVVLAQALVSQPRYVIIDELSLGLAPVVVQRLIPTIRSIAQDGIGVLLIEQFATVALGLSERAYVMEGGRIRYSGSGQGAPRQAGAAPFRVPVPRRADRERRARARGREADMTVTAMEHVLVLSDDIEATREFYCDVVGLRVGERPPLEFGGYWLYAGDTPCLHIAERHSYLTHAATLWTRDLTRAARHGPGRPHRVRRKRL